MKYINIENFGEYQRTLLKGYSKLINPNLNLILIKNEDQTENIQSWKYCDGYYFITFYGGNTYKYNYQSIKFYKDPQIISIKDVMILRNDMPLFSVKQVLVFQHHSKIFYTSGYKEIVTNSTLRFIHSVLSVPKSKECFEYYKEVAITVGLHDVNGTNILANRYRKIEFIREDSILSNYLSGKLDVSLEHKIQIIYPFGFNLSQKKAVQNAMLHSLSVIEGPPGTGKTQTILNIIANALMRGESVAVVSSNNSATKNILDKLNKYGIGFIAAYLGNGFNKKEFIENQITELPNFDEWNLGKEDYDQRYIDLSRMGVQMDTMLEIRNQLSKLNQQLEIIKLEYEHYMKYFNESNNEDKVITFKSGIKSERLLKLIILLESNESGKNTFWDCLNCFFRYGVRDRKFFKHNLNRKIAICQKYFYELKIKEFNAEIKKCKDDLNGYDFEDKMNVYSQKSLQILRDKIANQYKGQTIRASYGLDDLWKNSDQFIKDYPIILSTTYSLRGSLSNKFIYDYVIIDEASQVDLATGTLALSCAKKAVIVGDLKQLPNVITNEMKYKTDKIFERFNLNEAYRYSENSILTSVSKLFQNVPHTLLREHYRCNPKIIEFCNQKFYKNELIILTNNTEDEQPLVVYKTVKGNHKRDNTNLRQIDVIEKEVIPQQNLDITKDSIGIVTPYRNQAEYLQRLFIDTTIKADTVDKFQGQECNTIILSTVDDEITEFTDDPNRLNVAVSRAIKQLIVVTDGNESQKKTNIKDLIEYINYNNYEVIDSKIYSVFDYLYKSYYEMRRLYLQDKKKVSEYDSENLMYTLIREVLNTNAWCDTVDIAVHVPLRMLIRDLKHLDDEAIRYVTASGTHIDFVIYTKISKKIVLAIEVDGYWYHKEGTRQAMRDKIKNSVFDLYGIPYLRFITNGSEEKEVLIGKLSELLG